jgi:hypothetical protein
VFATARANHTSFTGLTNDTIHIYTHDDDDNKKDEYMGPNERKKEREKKKGP